MLRIQVLGAEIVTQQDEKSDVIAEADTLPTRRFAIDLMMSLRYLSYDLSTDDSAANGLLVRMRMQPAADTNQAK
jgi:hypothetical protein